VHQIVEARSWTTASGHRRSWYTDGVLHSEKDVPALVCFADYFVAMDPAGLAPKCGEVHHWFSRGSLHRDGDKPAVVYQRPNEYSKTHSALWYTSGVAHTPARVVLEGMHLNGMHLMQRKLFRWEGFDIMLWKGAMAYACTLACESEREPACTYACTLACESEREPACTFTHTRDCDKRKNRMCRTLAEFGPQDTVRYGKLGLINCIKGGPAAVRGGVEEWWYNGARVDC
jgi:hypothetical protein